MIEEFKKELTVANTISFSRPLLTSIANRVGIEHPLSYCALMSLAFLTDELDGEVARRLGSSKWGGMVDILSDRSLEGLMYFYLAKKKIIPKWVPAVVLTRGLITDALRIAHTHKKDNKEDIKDSETLRIGSRFASEIVESRAVRTGYALLKTSVAMTAPFNKNYASQLAQISAGICIIRGIPVIFSSKNLQLLK